MTQWGQLTNDTTIWTNHKPTLIPAKRPSHLHKKIWTSTFHPLPLARPCVPSNSVAASTVKGGGDPRTALWYCSRGYLYTVLFQADVVWIKNMVPLTPCAPRPRPTGGRRIIWSLLFWNGGSGCLLVLCRWFKGVGRVVDVALRFGPLAPPTSDVWLTSVSSGSWDG